MAKKARQHILPIVYQRPFADPNPPPGWSKSRPFEPRIWQIPKTLEASGKPKSPQKSFVATRYYNLRDDDPTDPAVERGLGHLEAGYGDVLPRVEAGEELALEEYFKLLLFIGGLRARTPRQIDHWRTQWAEVERIHRMVERAHTGQEQVSDARFWMRDESSKRMIFEHASSYANVVGPPSWLLINRSGIPFLSCDNPATHAFLHRDELERMGFAEPAMHPEAMRSHQAFFAYCPLTPVLAFVSSPLLLPPDESLYRVTDDKKHVLMLNEYMRHCAQEYLISPLEDPYGPAAELLRGMDRLRKELMANSSGRGVVVYTKDDRIECSCEVAVHEDGTTPLKSRIRFRTREIAALSGLTVGMEVGEVTVYDQFRPCAGIRGGRVLALASSPAEDTVIEGDVSVAI
jgi:hypothetical protein